ncbi:hypothetical protein [Streptomyces luteogriseus]|uniref:hypothetical protein n=1 Tax=Streptomyces luteogriseus TaxID=68233 RepID=UPI0037BD2656
MPELISDQELCDVTGIKPAYLKRLRYVGAHGDDPIPAAVYEYKKAVIFEKGPVRDWLIRLYTRGIQSFEDRLKVATEVVDVTGGLDSNVHFGVMRSGKRYSFKEIDAARKSYRELPAAISEDRTILENLKAL